MHFSCVGLVLLLYTRACDFIMRLHTDLFILMCLFFIFLFLQQQQQQQQKKKKKKKGTKKKACMECS